MTPVTGLCWPKCSSKTNLYVVNRNPAKPVPVCDLMYRSTGIVVLAALCCLLAPGQSRRTALGGHVSPRLRAATDLGEAGSDVSFSTLRISFQLSAEKQIELEALLAAQQDPGS